MSKNIYVLVLFRIFVFVVVRGQQGGVEKNTEQDEGVEIPPFV